MGSLLLPGQSAASGVFFLLHWDLTYFQGLSAASGISCHFKGVENDFESEPIIERELGLLSRAPSRE